MKQLITLLTCLFCLHSVGQLTSWKNVYSEVHGGMEDGGISRTELYYFLVTDQIILRDILLDGKRVALKKGDTLVVSVNSYKPYNNRVPVQDTVDYGELISNDSIPFYTAVTVEMYKVYVAGHTYYANVQYPYVWNKSIVYSHKKKTMTVIAKEGFDSGNTSYAP